MTQKSPDFDSYKVIAFLDANVILEGRPLAELPWQEVDPEGPVLLLLTPTAMKQIDVHKRDGRVGKIARAFNQTVSTVATGGRPVMIREDAPRVMLGLSTAERIDWDQYQDLDPNDSDHRIVAEVIHARGLGDAVKVVVSHDINPLAVATGRGLRTLRITDAWLRPAEPGPAEKEIQRLTQRLRQYEATEPSLEISIAAAGAPLRVFRIQDLTDSEGESIEHKIHELHPRESQPRDAFGMTVGLGNYDHSYSERFETYRTKRLPAFMARYAENIERLFNQTPFRLEVRNAGKVQAENLLIEVSVCYGWIHDRFVFVSPQGPFAPRPRTTPYFPMPNLGKMLANVGRHEMDYQEEPRRGESFSVTCADFRHGQSWGFEGVVGVDARRENATAITVRVTASNFRGEAEETLVVEKRIEQVHVSELIELEILKAIRHASIEDVIENEGIEAVDLGAADDD